MKTELQNDIINEIFNVSKSAKLFGTFVTLDLLGQGGDCDNIKVLLKNLGEFLKIKNSFSQLAKYDCSTTDMCQPQLKVSKFLVEVTKKQKHNPNPNKFEFNIGDKPFQQVFFKSLSLYMTSNREVDTFLNKKDEVYEHIVNRRLELSSNLKTLKNQGNYIYRNNYMSLIKESNQVIKYGWYFDPPLPPQRNTKHNNDLICAICQDDLKINSYMTLSCTHQYHSDCLEKHINTIGPKSDSCPVCNKAVF